MTKSSSFILRLYFAVISAITLIVLMYGTIDLLAAGLKTYVIPAADVPDYLENCNNLSPRYPVAVDTTSTQPTDEELKAQCEARNEDSIMSYERMKASAAVRNLALIIVSLPLFLLHFRIVHKDWTDDRKKKVTS